MDQQSQSLLHEQQLQLQSLHQQPPQQMNQQQEPSYLHHQQPMQQFDPQQQHLHQHQHQTQQHQNSYDQNQTEGITKELNCLDKASNDIAEDLRSTRLKVEELNLSIQQRNYYKNKLSPTDNDAQLQQKPTNQQQLFNMEKLKHDKMACEDSIKLRIKDLNDSKDRIISNQGDVIKRLSIVQNIILFERLPAWHQDQQFMSNGPNNGTSASGSGDSSGSSALVLDQIQAWIESILTITWRLRNQLKCLIHLMNSVYFEKYNHYFYEVNRLGLSIDKLLEAIILKSLIVEKQPPQVMKTNTRFASTVRFLGGDKLNLHMINPTVRVTILSEANARAVILRHQELIKNSWDLIDYNNQHNHESLNMTTSPIHQVAQVCNQANQQQQLDNNSYASLDKHQVSNHQQPVHTVGHQQPQFFQQQQQQPPPPQHPPPQYHSLSPSQHYQQYSPMETNTNLSIGATTQPCLKILNMNNFESSGEIINACTSLEYQETGQYVWHFRNMQLKKIRRTEKRGTESVMDEKFVLLFHAEFRIRDDLVENCWARSGDLSFHLMAFSLPVVVIVHGNQEPHAVATITWHSAFATPDGVLYYVPEKVTWPQLGRVLSEKFRAYAGKGLSDENLNYLAAKVSRTSSIANFNDESNKEFLLITWNQFAKENLPDKNFSFWEWFYSILKLTREHLAKLWEADKIHGFICKKTCSELLLTRSYSSFIDSAPNGTFILRFSETELGGITIAWVSSNGQQQLKDEYMIDRSSTGEDQLMQDDSNISHQQQSTSKIMLHIQPFLSKDLATRSLADRVRDLENLAHLYPNIPKDEAFGEYYTPIFDQIVNSHNGYVRPMLITTLVENYQRTSAATSPAAMRSPSSFSQRSPTTNEGIYQSKELNSNYNFGRI